MPFARQNARGLVLLGALILAALSLPAAARADAVAYRLDDQGSTVGFQTDFGSDKIDGSFPLQTAAIFIDFNDLRKSKVAVTLDVTGAKASFPFAAQAMKGPKVLDAASFPTIQFTSTAIRANGQDARIVGQVTLRGVTKPLEMTAHLYQAAGAQPGDYSHLTIALSGALNRSDFGATGWADMVGDQVRIQISARIDRE